MRAEERVVRTHAAAVGSGARPLKIVITGPFSAGKTTLIRSISEVAIVGTEQDVSDETRAVKNQTTVAMDFGRITFAEDLSLFLFGTPGQRRFEMMWEILSDGMIGFIVLVRADEPRSLEEAIHILQTFRSYADVPYVVGVTHLDQVNDDPGIMLASVRSILELPEEVPVLACDPRIKADVKSVLLETLYGVLGRLERTGARAG